MQNETNFQMRVNCKPQKSAQNNFKNHKNKFCCTKKQCKVQKKTAIVQKNAVKQHTHCILCALQKQNMAQSVVVQFFGIPGSGKSKILSELKKMCDHSKKTARVICDNLTTDEDLAALKYGDNVFAVQTKILDRIEKELLFERKTYDYVFIHTPLDMVELFILSEHLSKNLSDYEFQLLKKRIEKMQNFNPQIKNTIALYTDAKLAEKNILVRYSQLYQLECLLENFLRKRDIYCLTNTSCQDARNMAENIFQHLEKGWNYSTDLL